MEITPPRECYLLWMLPPSPMDVSPTMDAKVCEVIRLSVQTYSSSFQPCPEVDWRLRSELFWRVFVSVWNQKRKQMWLQEFCCNSSRQDKTISWLCVCFLFRAVNSVPRTASEVVSDHGGSNRKVKLIAKPYCLRSRILQDVQEKWAEFQTRPHNIAFAEITKFQTGLSQTTKTNQGMSNNNVARSFWVQIWHNSRIRLPEGPFFSLWKHGKEEAANRIVCLWVRCHS